MKMKISASFHTHGSPEMITIVKMVEVIEKCWLDLSKMNMSAEMNTSLMMSQIEKLLPALQRTEWTLTCQKLSKNKSNFRFEDLLEFVLNGKKA